MWALLVRAFLWMSTGYVVNDATTTIGSYFSTDSKDTSARAPWYVWPLVISGIIVTVYLWLRKKGKV